MIIKSLAKSVNEQPDKQLSDIKVIPHTIEKYTAIYTKEFVFIDSYQHLFASLETLVKDLKDKGYNHFKNLIEEFPDTEIRSNLFQKGLYTYS